MPTLSLLAKLGSIAALSDEILASNVSVSPIDRAELTSLICNREVQDWMEKMGPLIPRRKRT